MQARAHPSEVGKGHASGGSPPLPCRSSSASARVAGCLVAHGAHCRRFRSERACAANAGSRLRPWFRGATRRCGAAGRLPWRTPPFLIKDSVRQGKEDANSAQRNVVQTTSDALARNPDLLRPAPHRNSSPARRARRLPSTCARALLVHFIMPSAFLAKLLLISVAMSGLASMSLCASMKSPMRRTSATSASLSATRSCRLP